MSQSNYVRRTFDVVHSVTVSQPAVPLTVVEVFRGEGGKVEIVNHACVGIETRHIREYSLVVHRNEPQPLGGHRPKRLDARTLREEGWEFYDQHTDHSPMFIHPTWGIIAINDKIVCGGDTAFFATYANDPDYDAKLKEATEGLEINAEAEAKAEAGAQ